MRSSQIKQMLPGERKVTCRRCWRAEFSQRCRRRCELSYKELEDQCEVRGGGGKADKEGGLEGRRRQKMDDEGMVNMTVQERYEVMVSGRR